MAAKTRWRIFFGLGLLGLAILALRYYDDIKTSAGFAAGQNVLAADPSTILEIRSPADAMATTPSTPPVKMVLLLSYQCSGSSYVASMFNNSHDIFFIYEPLDLLYSAMYGVEEGWTVPSDIFNNEDGSIRVLPEDERIAAEWLLEKIYTCQMTSLPPSMLLHKFWDVFGKLHSHGQDYLSCLVRKDLLKKNRGCQLHIRKTCGKRFSSHATNTNNCKRHLWGESVTNRDNFTANCLTYRSQAPPGGMPAEFKTYFTCLQQYDQAARECAATYLDAPCRNKTVRAMKSVRAEVTEVENLLKKYAGFYLIHLFRDPRAATTSIHREVNAQGLYAHHNIGREAALYCSQVMVDFAARERLNQQYPGRTMHMVYEDVVKNPSKAIEKIFGFLDVAPGPGYQARMKTSRRGVSSIALANRWRVVLNASQQHTVREVCKKVYEIPLPNPWPPK